MSETKPRRRVVSWDLFGWKEIAEALGRSVRTAQRWASAAKDPLPVLLDRGGRAVARRADLAAWAERNCRTVA